MNAHFTNFNHLFDMPDLYCLVMYNLICIFLLNFLLTLIYIYVYEYLVSRGAGSMDFSCFPEYLWGLTTGNEQIKADVQKTPNW